MLEQAAQLLADCAGLLGLAKGVLELAENLRLAEHHRIQAACDPEYVPDRLVRIERKQRIAEGGIEITVIM